MKLVEGKAYELVPSEQNPLEKTFGSAALMVEVACFELCSNLTKEYTGGQWEFRRYVNGALMMVFNDQTEVRTVSGNQRDVFCTVEAISIVAWMMAVSQANMLAHERNDEKLSTICHDLYHACRDMVCGSLRFVIDSTAPDGYRQPTEEEAVAYAAIAEREHPHAPAIMELLD